MSRRILFISTNELDGGSEILWRHAAERLRRLGYEIRAGLVDSRAGGGTERFLRDAEVDVRFYRIDRKKLVDKLDFYLRGEHDRNALLSHFRPELVVISQGGCQDGVAWAELCVERGHPFVTVSQAVRTDGWPTDALAERLCRIVGAARQNFFVSEDNRRLFSWQIAAPVEPSAVIFNPYQVDREIKLAWPSEEDGFRLAIVARIALQDKGHDLLLGALREPRWRDRPVTVDCFGDGAGAQTFTRLVKMLGLEAKVRFRGFTADVASIWRDHHALVLPSRSEGFSLAMSEAMLCERPVITTRVSDNERVVEHGVSGFVIDGDNVAAVDRALEAAWEKRSRWKEIGRNARKRILAHLPPDPVGHFVRQVLDCLELRSTARGEFSPELAL